MSLLSFTVFRSAGGRFWLPLLLTMALTGAMDWVVATSSANHDLIIVLPYILLIVTIPLSQLFNQGRTGMVAILILGSYYIIQTHLQSPLLEGTNKLEFSLLTSLLPLNLLLIQFLPEYRLFSRVGLLYLSSVAAQVAGGVLLINQLKDTDLSWLWESYLYVQPDLSPLPINIMIFSVMCTVVSTFIMFKRNQGSDQAIFICLFLSGMTFSLFQLDYISSSFFILTASLLLLNLISCSHEFAFDDPLTKLSGRRALEIEMKYLGRLYTIAMLDIDHFKKFNDNYGHDAGDDVLKLVATLMKSTRGGARIFRYGGEEFTILFNGKKAQDCMEYLEELRQNIANYELFLRDLALRPEDDIEGINQRKTKSKKKPVNITVSIGVADSVELQDPEDVIKAADKALYIAKDTGRNRVKCKQHLH